MHKQKENAKQEDHYAQVVFIHESTTYNIPLRFHFQLTADVSCVAVAAAGRQIKRSSSAAQLARCAGTAG